MLALDGPVEANAAEDEGARVDEGVAHAAERGGKFVHGDKALQRIVM